MPFRIAAIAILMALQSRGEEKVIEVKRNGIWRIFDRKMQDKKFAAALVGSLVGVWEKCFGNLQRKQFVTQKKSTEHGRVIWKHNGKRIRFSGIPGEISQAHFPWKRRLSI